VVALCSRINKLFKKKEIRKKGNNNILNPVNNTISGVIPFLSDSFTLTRGTAGRPRNIPFFGGKNARGGEPIGWNAGNDGRRA